MHDLVVEKWSENQDILYFLKARNAKNLQGTNRWILHDFYERSPSDSGDVIIEGKKKEATFEFTIDEMARRDNIVEAMTYGELKEFIAREQVKGSSKIPSYQIDLYQRTSLPFATYVLTLIGVSVASRKKRGGIGVNIAIGLGIVFVYIFAMKVMAVAALNVGCPAVIAVWVPNLLFAGVAYLLYRSAVR